jgi:CRISPR-associated protein Cmr6
MTWRIPRLLPWRSPYPLPQDTVQALADQEHRCANLGLLMDRYLAYSAGRQAPELLPEFRDRRALELDMAPLGELIAAHLARWQDVADRLGAVTFDASPEWRVVVGLGRHALLEGGIALHRVYGFPLIPATALKGAARFYAEVVLELPAEEVAVLFGTGGEESRPGELIFLDAVPVIPPRLERDVINPHMARYYYGGTGNTPPADYLSPAPIFFLAVGRGSTFRFGVAGRSGSLERARQAAGWLQETLGQIGLGAKTRAGYGYWVVREEAAGG